MLFTFLLAILICTMLGTGWDLDVSNLYTLFLLIISLYFSAEQITFICVSCFLIHRFSAAFQ